MDQHRAFLRVVVWGIGALAILQMSVLLLVVPWFELTLRFMFGGPQLPMITAGVINARWGLVALTCILPLGAWLIVRQGRSPQGVAVALASILMVAVVQIPLTAFALLMPLVPFVQSLQRAG